MREISPIRDTSTPQTLPQTSAKKSEDVSSRLVYDVHGNDSDSETVTNLNGRARSNALFRQQAVQGLATHKLSPGTPIKATSPVPQTSSSGKKAEMATAKSPDGTTVNSPVAARPKLTKEELADTKDKLGKLRNLFVNVTGEAKSKVIGAPRDMSTYTLYFDKDFFGDKSYMRIEKDTPENLSARQRYLHSGGNAREVAGQKLLELFQKAGLTITDEIRQALPGKKSLGDAKIIDIAIKASLLNLAITEKRAAIPPATKDQLLQATKDELSARKQVIDNKSGKPIPGKTTPQINWDTGEGISTLLRGTSTACKMLDGYLGDMFRDTASRCVSMTTQAAHEVLKNTGSPDKAMMSAYLALLDSLKDVEFSKDFIALAGELTQLVDNAAGKKNNEHVNAAKKTILMNLILRTLIPEIADQLSLASGFFENAATQALKPGEHLPKGISLVNVAQRLQELFNGTRDKQQTQNKFDELENSLSNYAALLKDTNFNNLNTFTAFASLQRTALG